jgi:hypothetical protein
MRLLVKGNGILGSQATTNRFVPGHLSFPGNYNASRECSEKDLRDSNHFEDFWAEAQGLVEMVKLLTVSQEKE